MYLYKWWQTWWLISLLSVGFNFSSTNKCCFAISSLKLGLRPNFSLCDDSHEIELQKIYQSSSGWVARHIPKLWINVGIRCNLFKLLGQKAWWCEGWFPPMLDCLLHLHKVKKYGVWVKALSDRSCLDLQFSFNC